MSPTATYSPTLSPTFTISPTWTLTPLPTLVVMQVDVLDANLNVVAHLTLSGGSGTVNSITLSKPIFIPEVDRNLGVRADQGAQGSWNGLGLDNSSALPNGYYHIHVTQPGQAAIDVAFLIQHQDYNGGNIVALNGAIHSGTDLKLAYAYPEQVQLGVRVYNSAGELVSQASGAGTVGAIQLSLRSASGMQVAAGVYLIQVRGVTVNGGVEFLKLLKVAVVR